MPKEIQEQNDSPTESTNQNKSVQFETTTTTPKQTIVVQQENKFNVLISAKDKRKSFQKVSSSKASANVTNSKELRSSLKKIVNQDEPNKTPHQLEMQSVIDPNSDSKVSNQINYAQSSNRGANNDSATEKVTTI